VLIFGAGYDATVEDADPTSDGARSMGRGVFVVNAYTGAMMRHIRPAKMDYAIPSDITLIDFDRNGFVDRLYFGDTGGQVWRVDTGGAKDPTSWTTERIASLGIGPESGNSGDVNRRKFLFAPDVVETAPGSGVYAILVASGDRENPLNGATGRSTAPVVQNRVYMLIDGAPRGSTVITEAQLDNRTSANNVDPANLGWYVTLTQPGEKVTGSVITLAGASYFGTNYPVQPAAGSCQSNLGNARFYTVDFLTAGGRGGGVSTPSSDITANRFTEIEGGGLPPSPVGTIISSGPSKYMEGVIMGTKVLPVGPAKVGDRFRNYWYKKFDKK
jgi:type IV pilus assembly protein PilY1